MAGSLIAPEVPSGGWYDSTAYEEHVAPTIEGPGGLLHSLAITNSAATDFYVWVFEGTSSSGRVICPPFKVVAGGTMALDWRYGRPFSKSGLYVALSSSLTTFSALGANSGWFQIGWGART